MSLKSINSCTQHGGFCRAESGDEVPHAAKVRLTDLPVSSCLGSVLEMLTELLVFILSSGASQSLWALRACSL